MSAHIKMLLEKVRKEDVEAAGVGMNGLIAISGSMVYLINGTALENKTFRTFEADEIKSVTLKKPSFFSGGYLHIETIHDPERTKPLRTRFDFASNRNTVMFSKNVKHFEEVERLLSERMIKN